MEIPQGPEPQCKYTDFNVGPAASQIAHNAKPSGSSLLLAFHGATQATLRDLSSGLSSSTEPCRALPTAQCPQLRVVFCLQALPQGWLSDSQEKAQTEQQGLGPRLQGQSAFSEVGRAQPGT